MRIVFAALVLVAAASAAAAQSHGGLIDDMPTPSIGLPLAHIGLPLPPMGLPLPPMGLPPERSRPFDRTDILGRSERSERSNILKPERAERAEQFNRPASIIFFGWPYLPTAEFPASPSPSPPPPPKQTTGRLLLSLHSGIDPQIFVDGYYVGLFSDVAGELILDVGAHRIEFHEEGFQDARVDVKIPLDGTITYDVTLKSIDAAPLPSASPVAPAPSPAPPPTTIYVVPGCYAGNVPPQQVKLPAGCDARGSIAFPSR
jgi:hypothetical protein